MAKRKIAHRKRAPKPNGNGASKPAKPGAQLTKFRGTLPEMEQFVDTIRAERAARNPHPLAEAKELFADGEARTDTTLLQIIRGMFDAPNNRKTGNHVADFLADVLLSGADDAYLVQNLNTVVDHDDVVDRVLMRASWRAEFAVEIARRVERGEVKS